MGRPLNKRHFGDFREPGKQVSGIAWIPGESAAEEVIAIQQKTTQKYEVASVADENITGFVVTANTATPAEGEFSIAIDPDDGTGNSTGVEYARQINGHQVKTFDGNTYTWSQLLSADFSGPISSAFGFFASMTIGYGEPGIFGQPVYGYDSDFPLGVGAMVPTLVGESTPNGGTISYVSFYMGAPAAEYPGYFSLQLTYTEPPGPGLERMTFREDSRLNINGVEYAFPYDGNGDPVNYEVNGLYSNDRKYLSFNPSVVLYAEYPNPVYNKLLTQLSGLVGQTVPMYVDFGRPSSAP